MDTRTILSALALSLLGGCAVQVREGNGTEATEHREVEAFDGVSATMSIEVAIAEGEPLVEVTCDENLLDEIETVVEDGQLVVRTNQHGGAWVSIDPHAPCHVYVQAPELHEAASTGSGRLVVTGESARIEHLTNTGSGGVLSEAILSAPEVTIDNTASGGVEVAEVIAGGLVLTSSGSGGMDILAGTAEAVQLTITGSGSVLAMGVIAEDVEATLTGSGSGEITATESIEATITGSGSLHVEGDPDQRDVSEPGSGSVIFE